MDALAVISFVSALAAFGLERVTLRQCAEYAAHNAQQLLICFVRWSWTRAAASSLVAALVIVLLRGWVGDALGISPSVVGIAALTIPLATLLMLQQCVLRGLHHLWQSQIVLGFVRPASLLTLWILGTYSVAARCSSVVPLALNFAMAAMAPVLAHHHARGETNDLSRLGTRITLVGVAFGLPVALVLLVWGKPLLAVIFGASYASAYPALAILCAGQIINVSMGPVAGMLIMTGMERHALSGVAGAAVVNVVVGLLLIPGLGAVGAAIASASALTVWNLCYAVLVNRHLHIAMPWWLPVRRAPNIRRSEAIGGS